MASVLVVGSGAREHAICRQLLKSEQVDTVYCAPGNPGMAEDSVNCVAIDELAFDALVGFAEQENVDLTIIGPELPLQQGIVNVFEDAGLKAFGPNKAAAQLEGSKKFAKQIMNQANVPTGSYQDFTDEQSALTALKTVSYPIVIKANGLAAGKGVVIANDRNTAEATVHEMLGKHEFDTTEVIFEEFLSGQEFSFMAFVSGDQIVPMPLAQDHKAAYEGDKGPNTGGMGAYSPLPQFPADLATNSMKNILKPVINQMTANGTPFRGILYAGLIYTNQGPKVIEFNVRFGDPETAVVLPQLQSDFYQLLMDLIDNQPVKAQWQTKDTYLGVVVSTEHYPLSSGSGDDLSVFAKLPDDLKVNYAGVKLDDQGKLVSSGGRVLCVLTHDQDIPAAQQRVYRWLDAQKLAGLRYRTDIGDKGRV